MSMKVPVVAEVGEAVTVLNVLAVGEVTVVGVVLSIVHIYGNRLPYFRQTMVLFKDIQSSFQHLLHAFKRVYNHKIVDFVPKFMEVPVAAEVGVVVSLLNVLAVGVVTVVGVVVLSLMHTHRVRYFAQITFSF